MIRLLWEILVQTLEMWCLKDTVSSIKTPRYLMRSFPCRKCHTPSTVLIFMFISWFLFFEDFTIVKFVFEIDNLCCTTLCSLVAQESWGLSQWRTHLYHQQISWTTEYLSNLVGHLCISKTILEQANCLVGCYKLLFVSRKQYSSTEHVAVYL